jgi:hypothetical protein
MRELERRHACDDERGAKPAAEVLGSPKNHTPIRNVPAAPMPVHTA